MDLTTAIKHIIDGNAVIIMGAGASHGATNAFGDFPSGSKLAESLYDSCNITPDDKNDLQDAAQTFEEMHSAAELIREIRIHLTCASFAPYHSTIYSQPWRRYYTTNYDDVALLAAKANGVNIFPVTLSSDFNRYYKQDRLCIHINGYLGNLNETTLHTEFKLTADSYLSHDYISNSQWGALLTDDLDAAKCIVILGLSLKYDLDLSRLLYAPELKAKTVIIDRPDLSPNSEAKLSRFGTVKKIGVSGFADEIENVSLTYTPSATDPLRKLYTCFEHEFHRASALSKAVPGDVYKLFFSGTYANELFYQTRGAYTGFVYRSKFHDIREAILGKKKYIFIHADMGNGKTASVQELRAWLSRKDFHVFTLVDINIINLVDEIQSICAIEAPCVVIIENYTSYMDVLRIFSRQPNDNVQFVFTARSAVNFSKMPDVFDQFSIKENESVVININKLGSADISRCVDLFDFYGAWGKNANLSNEEKRKFLKNRNHGNSKFQSIMLDVLKSDDMVNRIKSLVETIRSESKIYHEAVIVILITQVMNLRISAKDIEKVTGQSIVTDAKFRANPAIQELLDFRNGRQSFVMKSSVTSNLILREIAGPEMIIDALNNLALYAVTYKRIAKYSSLLNDIISFSHISSFLNEYHDSAAFLASYYDKLSEIEYYRSSNFFWLQYAISCIEVSEYQRAQKYLDNAYGLIPEGFVPFQINNQQARLYLEEILSNTTKNPLDNFKKAHRLLMLPIVSVKDNEFNVIKLFGHYTRKEFKARLNTEELKAFHGLACKEAYNRLTSFVGKHHEYMPELRDLSRSLLKSAFKP